MTTTPNPSGADKRDGSPTVAAGNVGTLPNPVRAAGDASSHSGAPSRRNDDPTFTTRSAADASRAVGEPCSPKALECLADIEKNVSQLRRELGAPAAATHAVQEPGSSGPSGSKQRTGSIPGMTL